MTNKIYIAIAEDHNLVRRGLVSMLSKYPEIEIAIEASNGKMLLDKLKEFKPDVLLLDIEMPVAGGIFALEKIKKKYPEIKVIVLSIHSGIDSIVEYIQLGASSFLTKNCDLSILVEAINKVHQDEMYFEKHVYKKLSQLKTPIQGINTAKKKKKPKFTARDIELLKFLSNDTPYADIANEMKITEGTVHWHRYKLHMRTGTKDDNELLRFAATHQII